ncbi:arylsulfatase [Agaribacter marinus]|nr:arylsulfatase [Agaribacter marinus]
MSTAKNTSNQQTPNVVLIVTDDQGFGDLGVNGNPIIDTPNLDELARQGVNLTNFHVDPTCSPTRAALLTGKHSLHAGVWHTILGRYMLGPEHQTIAEVLKDNGYRTGIFGKWHLGDNYPYRPQDQGFDEVLIHGGGGVGQTPDYWGNTQFDDTYFHNGEPIAFKGYATKVWFDAAKDFISDTHNVSATKKSVQPFFTYIPLNAPHGPYRAPEEYIQTYLSKGLPRALASFYAMITYVDEQVAGLQSFLADKKLLDNTIFIFMTDNGSSFRLTNHELTLNKDYVGLAKSFPTWQPNANLRGYKGEVFEGGHKVPFFLSYPNGKLKEGNVDELLAHYDVMPTLLDMVGIKPPEGLTGQSAKSLLLGETSAKKTFRERSVVITNQRVDKPSVLRPTVVAYQDWRLISGVKDKDNNEHQLYLLSEDPNQQNNIVDKFPDITKRLVAERNAWWSEAKRIGFKDRFIGVGYPQENPVRLNAMDWMEVPEKQPVPWFIGHQPPAPEWDYVHWLTEEANYSALPWYIDVATSGKYKISIYFHDIPAGTPILKDLCVVDVNGTVAEAKVHGRAALCEVTLDLYKGEQKLTAWFTDDAESLSKEKAAFYVYIEKLK